jgi:putative membrane protein insertion efficiency factor
MTTSFVTRALLAPIRFYRRFVSPALPATCRYEPSCSAYAVDALLQHGAVRGSWMSVRRISRCHPWHRGGYDPVPPARERHGRSGSSVTVNPVSDRQMNAERSIDSSSRRQEEAGLPVLLTTDARSAAAEPPTPRSNAA